jgi:hypothetical protein
MRVDVEGFCLSWTTTALAADLTVTRGPDRPQPQEIRFRFVVDAPYRRVRVNMVFPVGNIVWLCPRHNHIKGSDIHFYPWEVGWPPWLSKQLERVARVIRYG